MYGVLVLCIRLSTFTGAISFKWLCILTRYTEVTVLVDQGVQ